MIKCNLILFLIENRLKLLGGVAEELTDSIIGSINQIHKKEIEGISKKIQEAKSDDSKIFFFKV